MLPAAAQLHLSELHARAAPEPHPSPEWRVRRCLWVYVARARDHALGNLTHRTTTSGCASARTNASNPADPIEGIDEYGEAAGCGPQDECTFSVPFRRVAWREMLFATGDGARWLRARGGP